MIVNVLEMLRPLILAEKQKTAGALEDLAARIASGLSMGPQEIAAALDRLKATPEELAKEVDRQGELIALRRDIKEGVSARRRLKTINEELDRATAAVEAAQKKSDDFHSAMHGEWKEMRDAVRAADEAATMITQAKFLPAAARDRVSAIEVDMQNRAKRLEDCRDSLPMLRMSIEEAQRNVSLDERDSDRHAKAQRKVEVRKARLKDVEAEIARLTGEAEDLARERAAIYEGVRKAAEA